MSVSKQKLSIQRILATLRGAGEETRLRLLVLLSRGERTVKDMTFILGQSQPRISRHLKLMMESGLVERYQEGNWVFYRLQDDDLLTSIVKQMLDLISPDDPMLTHDLEASEKLKARRRLEAQAYFRDHAAQWDDIRSKHIPEKQVEHYLLEKIGHEKAELAIDLGTGTGHTLELLAANAKRAIGIDLSSQMLAYARARMESRNLGHCQLRQGDLYDLPLESEVADIVLMHQVLHFLETPQKAVMEACRLLKPNGLLMIVDFATHNLEILREQHAHQRLGFKQTQIESWLQKEGLAPIETTIMESVTQLEGQPVSVLVWSAQKPQPSA